MKNERKTETEIPDPRKMDFSRSGPTISDRELNALFPFKIFSVRNTDTVSVKLTREEKESAEVFRQDCSRDSKEPATIKPCDLSMMVIGEKNPVSDGSLFSHAQELIRDRIIADIALIANRGNKLIYNSLSESDAVLLGKLKQEIKKGWPELRKEKNKNRQTNS